MMIPFALFVFGNDAIDEANSKCDQPFPVNHKYDGRDPEEYCLQLRECPDNSLDFNRHGVTKLKILNSILDAVKQNLKATMETKNGDDGTTYDVNRLTEQTNLVLYEMAEDLYLKQFNLKVKCVDALYRFIGHGPSTLFHLDKGTRPYKHPFPRYGFNDCTQKIKYWEKLRDQQWFNVWIKLNDAKNYPLAFILDPKGKLETDFNGFVSLNGGDYDAYYYKLVAGDVLLFESSKVAHAGIKINEDETPRESLEFRCLPEIE
eukprot:NODE_257_length_11653_cov_0.298858.p6 type:complete len:261 gc:universal NODE_257_length_11653_cov_0.298858:3791-3009(-)